MVYLPLYAFDHSILRVMNNAVEYPALPSNALLVPNSAIPTPPKESDATTLLFRKELIEAQGSQWMGAIRLAQPISSTLIAAFALCIAGLLIAFVSLGSFTKKARVSGITIPTGGSLSIIAPSGGIVVRSLVKEGEKVRLGQPLFELSNARQGAQGEITALIAQQIAVRNQTLEAERRMRVADETKNRHAIDARLLNLSEQGTQLDQEIGLAERRHGLAQKSLSNYETLQKNGFVSQAQTQQKQEDSIDVAARLSALVRAKAQLQANRLSLQAEKDSLVSSLGKELSQMDRAQATLSQEMAENSNRRESLIVAPQAGGITTITYQPGQAVVAGQVLATLVSSGSGDGGKKNELEVHLYAASRTAGFVAVGQPVRIRYQAFPYQKFGLYDGTVADVSTTPFAPSELPVNLASTILSNAQQNTLGFNSNEALYRIKVKVAKQSVDAYGKEQPLKPGMTLDADILQDRRKIWEWVLEPLLAISHR